MTAGAQAIKVKELGQGQKITLYVNHALDWTQGRTNRIRRYV